MLGVQAPWTVHYEKEVPHSLNDVQVPLHHFLETASREYASHRAINFLGMSMTYSDLFRETETFSRGLQQLGVKKGDRVAIMLPNSPQAVIAYYGTLQVGGVVVQTNPMYMERELEHQLIDSGATVIVCIDQAYKKVADVLPKTAIEHVIVTSVYDYLPKHVLQSLLQREEGERKGGGLAKLKEGGKLGVDISQGDRTVHWKQFMCSDQPPLQKVDVAANDLALLQYTGGTTGLSKGVMLTHANLVANTEQIKAWCYKMRMGEEKFLGVLPFFHVYGMTTTMNLAIRLASELILLPRFEATDVLKTIHAFKPTFFPGVPTMYIGLLAHPEFTKYDTSSIEACISGAAPLPFEVQQKFEQLTGGRLVEGYGLTEASPVTHFNPLWGTRKAGSIGIPLSDTQCKIIDLETGEALPQGEVGELAVRGPQVMQGYWQRPYETAVVFKDGWLLTGDMARMDEDGYFYIVDRKKDMILAGGFNIYPREIEEVLYEHEAVKEAVVAGVPDPYRGETIKAYIVQKEGKNVSAQQFETYCRERLAAYKVPRLYEFRDELPQTLVGKILRRALVEEEIKKAQLAETEPAPPTEK
ncbi:long-chain-fatty-acid--CoA ligase [Numidum massiliense]|uniref:long-chain-fatty-acid--CoA ligase n=1 Tax=Numidum massiliense TaxID=1522315 RepID=UPI0006D59BD8|nr:long-chain fatty acid--CoA ligase [Numidum massiliense]